MILLDHKAVVLGSDVDGAYVGDVMWYTVVEFEGLQDKIHLFAIPPTNLSRTTIAF